MLCGPLSMLDFDSPRGGSEAGGPSTDNLGPARLLTDVSLIWAQ